MRKLAAIVLVLAWVKGIQSQEIFSNDYALYLSESAEVILEITNSPNEEGITLHPQNAETPEIIFNEGMNVISAPLAENVNYKGTLPYKNFKFISDGTSPKSELSFMGAPAFSRNDSIFFGKGLRLNIDAFDELSGLNEIYYSLNGNEYAILTNKVKADLEGENILRVFSKDYVGNKENIQKSKFYIDLTPPQTVCEFSGKRVENTVSSKSSLYLKCYDNLSGVKEIRYVLNTGLSKTYTTPIALDNLPDGTYFINYFATDMVGNQKPHDVPESNLAFHIDNAPPILKIETIGPTRHKGDITYVSEMTQIKIEAEDFRAGVENIYFGLNNELAGIEFRDPISFEKNKKIQYISYQAKDKVGNISKVFQKTYTIDDTPPKTYATINNKVLDVSDTIEVDFGTKINLVREDEESGVLKTYFSTDDTGNRVFVREIIAQKNKFKLKFYSFDHVLNKEKVNEINFKVLPSEEQTANRPGGDNSILTEEPQGLQLY